MHTRRVAGRELDVRLSWATTADYLLLPVQTQHTTTVLPILLLPTAPSPRVDVVVLAVVVVDESACLKGVLYSGVSSQKPRHTPNSVFFRGC